jgi:hypothetical protein
LGALEDVRAAANRFLTNCAYADVSVNKETTNDPHQIGVFCGVLYDYEHATRKVPQAMLEKLSVYVSRFNKSRTFQSTAALFGVLFHVSAVLRAPLSNWYHVIKWYRKAMSFAARSFVSLRTTIKFWNSVRPELEAWLDYVNKNPITPNTTPTPTDVHLYTDASDSGWGAVLFIGDGTYRVVAGSWSAVERSRTIAERETMAVSLGITAFRDKLKSSSFHLHVDNTAAMWSIAKGYSRAYFLNSRVSELRQVLASLHSKFDISFVCSENNIADGPSRGKIAQLTSPEGLGGLKQTYPIRKTATGGKSWVEVVRG